MAARSSKAGIGQSAGPVLQCYHALMSARGKIFVSELVAHIISGPRPIIYKKLGLSPDVDFSNSAIGIVSITPPEAIVIASDIAIKAGDVYLGFIDRFSGTLIITGRISEVGNAIEQIVYYLKGELGFASCQITKR